MKRQFKIYLGGILFYFLYVQALRHKPLNRLKLPLVLQPICLIKATLSIILRLLYAITSTAGFGELLNSLIPAAANVVQAETACRELSLDSIDHRSAGVADLLVQPYWQNIDKIRNAAKIRCFVFQSK